jgi:hypothetical protein
MSTYTISGILGSVGAGATVTPSLSGYVFDPIEIAYSVAGDQTPKGHIPIRRLHRHWKDRAVTGVIVIRS